MTRSRTAESTAPLTQSIINFALLYPQPKLVNKSSRNIYTAENNVDPQKFTSAIRIYPIYLYKQNLMNMYPKLRSQLIYIYTHIPASQEIKIANANAAAS